MRITRSQLAISALAAFIYCVPAAAQVNRDQAAAYFAQAAALCGRDDGKLWGMSLCGPMVFYDAVTKSIATNQPEPEAPRPAPLGYANAALNWGGVRWSTYVWRMLPPLDEATRGRLLMHELFHRVQPQLGLFGPEGDNAHLDTLEGRYWIQLEWRALARALGSTGDARVAAVRDALAFRAARFQRFPDAAENERRLQINEGLAEYTGTVTASATAAEATADAIAQLVKAEKQETFVRTFPYPTGTAYGLLLDYWSKGWTRRMTVSGDVVGMLGEAAGLTPAADVNAAAGRYDAAGLRVAEEARDKAHQLRIQELRRRFVDGPVLVVPNGRNASFITNGITPLGGAGVVTPGFRVTGDWGSLSADLVLVSADRSKLSLPAPFTTSGTTISGDGWTLTLAAGWAVRPGSRAGDFEVGPLRSNSSILRVQRLKDAVGKQSRPDTSQQP